MVSNSNTARRLDYYSSSKQAGEISETLRAMEASIFEELSEMHHLLQQQPEHDLQSLKNVAQLQCALDIVQSAKTPEEKATVYDILQHLKKPTPG